MMRPHFGEQAFAMQRLSTLPARTITRLAARIGARLRRSTARESTLLGQSFRLNWVARATPPYTTVVHIRIGTAGFALLFDDLALTPELTPEVMIGLSESARRVCIAYVLADPIQAVASATQQSVAVVDVHYRRLAEAPAMRLPWTLEWADGSGQRHGCLVPDDDHAWQMLDQLTSHLSDNAPPESPEEDAEWVRFVLGSSSLTAAQCDALQPGWVVLIQNPERRPRGFTAVRSDGEVVAALEIERNSVHARKVEEESSVKVSVIQDGPGAAAQESIDDVTVGLGFELGGAIVSLSALRHLAPGDVLELDRPIEACTVHIRAGDKTVGTGELLDLEGMLGVRILTLNGRG
jgi:type III secretion system YscQ/HrcQ family protein